MAQGRGRQYLDIQDRKKVCVIGAYLAQTAYGGSAVGQTIKIGANKYTIVGVLAQQADEAEQGGTDDCVYLPYTTAARLSFTGQINSYTLTVTDEARIERAKTVVEEALYAVYNDEDYYSVITMSELVGTMTSMIHVVITILTVIAGGVTVRTGSDGKLRGMLQTTPVVLDSIGANTVSAGGTDYTLADGVQVYLYKAGELYQVSITDLNAEGYILTGWYDNFGCTAGGRVRIVAALKK